MDDQLYVNNMDSWINTIWEFHSEKFREATVIKKFLITEPLNDQKLCQSH